LNTQEAKDPGRQFITREGLADYVSDNVSRITNKKQRPTDLSDPKTEPPLADLNQPGLSPFDTPEVSKLNIYGQQDPTRRGRRTVPAKPPSGPIQGYPDELARTIDIENQGEDILLKYLKGDEIALDENDFRACQNSFHELLASEPGSPYLSAREAFCQGRAEMFQASQQKAQSRDQAEATSRNAEELLEKAIRLDPGAAYPYNALGLLWLERSRYDLARAAFEDASHWAPDWAYPRHNLALTLVQSGDYEAAVATYKDAIAMAPQYFYLPYSLGLVYQRMNRLDDAEEYYRRAASLAPARPEPYTGIGAVRVLRGQWKQAEIYFRKALEQPDPLPVAAQAARHNLAMTLARNSGGAEAVRLWKQNSGYLPSELTLAQYQENEARHLGWRDPAANTAAIDQYRKVLSLSGGELHIQMSLAEVLRQAGRVQEAIAHNQSIAAAEPRNVAALENLGDLFMLDHRPSEACDAWQRALAADAKSPVRKRMLQKLRACTGWSR